jgi:hypothetical protein
MTTQSRRLEGHQSKREPEERPAHVVGGARTDFREIDETKTRR